MMIDMTSHLVLSFLSSKVIDYYNNDDEDDNNDDDEEEEDKDVEHHDNNKTGTAVCFVWVDGRVLGFREEGAFYCILYVGVSR